MLHEIRVATQPAVRSRLMFGRPNDCTIAPPELVVLPKGSFLMGSSDDDPSHLEDESPQHKVTIAHTLAIGRYPVTFAQWDACVADGGTTYQPNDNGWGRGNRPVINVSWYDTQVYLNWLNQKMGLNADDPERYRLPSEAEWEYACRAGTQGLYNTPDGLIGPHCANYDVQIIYEGAPQSGHHLAATTPVGSYPANRWGLYDMHGNVWEWIQDTYETDYQDAPLDGSAREGSSLRRGVRGGSWDSIPQYLRSALRGRESPRVRLDYLGFRVAKTIQG